MRASHVSAQVVRFALVGLARGLAQVTFRRHRVLHQCPSVHLRVPRFAASAGM